MLLKLFCLLTGSLACCAAVAATVDPTMSTIDGDLPAACAQRELAALRAEITGLAAGRDPEDAWRLVLAMVCQEGPAAHEFIMEHMPERIPDRLEGPTAKPDDVLMVDHTSKRLASGYARGQAWGATAELSGAGILVNFMTGFNCWAGFTMHSGGSAWSIVSLSGGCD